MILNRFCNVQKAIKEDLPLAPIEFFVHHDTGRNLLVICEHHKGTLLLDQVKEKGLEFGKRCL